MNTTAPTVAAPLDTMRHTRAHANRQHATLTFEELFPGAAIRHEKDKSGLAATVRVNTAELNGEQMERLNLEAMFTTPQITVRVRRSGTGLVVLYEWKNS